MVPFLRTAYRKSKISTYKRRNSCPRHQNRKVSEYLESANSALSIPCKTFFRASDQYTLKSIMISSLSRFTKYSGSESLKRLKVLDEPHTNLITPPSITRVVFFCLLLLFLQPLPHQVFPTRNAFSYAFAVSRFFAFGGRLNSVSSYIIAVVGPKYLDESNSFGSSVITTICVRRRTTGGISNCLSFSRRFSLGN